MMNKLRIKAIEVQVGDIVVDLSEVDYRVKRIRRTPCANPNTPYINEQDGWVCLGGDSDDNYFKRFYDGEEDFYVALLELITVIREK